MTTFKRVAALPLIMWVAAWVFMAPAAAAAQDPLGEPLRRAEARILLLASRAQLGVMLGGAERVGDRMGVRVERPIPGGPADRAGIEAGDILLTMDGEALGDEPGRDLSLRMASVEPGDTVTIVLHRDGRDHTVRVVTDRSRTPLVLRPGVAARPAVDALLRDLRPALAMLGRHRMELVEMNPGLGRYFGVDDGVLVTNVAAESPLGLEPGDVIVAIDGRAVRDPAHARAILASYHGDEEAELRVVRDRRTITVRSTPGTRR